MRALRLVGALSMTAILVGCSGEDPVMPDVAGQRLDSAQSAIEDAGFDDDVEIEGGGLFGVLEEANWVVCEQSPPAGQTLTGKPRLTVDRSCEDDQEPSEDAEPTESASPDPEPSEDPEIITARNSEEFGDLLVLDDNCAGSIKSFAKQNADRTIQFNGAIVAMANHGSYTTRYDILMNAGDYDPNTGQGPSFKFEDVNVFDLDLTGRRVPDTIGVGDEFTFTATVDRYVPRQCLFFLDPVSTEIR